MSTTNDPILPASTAGVREHVSSGRRDTHVVLPVDLRDYFAAQAIQICLQASAAHDGCYDYAAAAIGAYEMADAMIAERKG